MTDFDTTYIYKWRFGRQWIKIWSMDQRFQKYLFIRDLHTHNLFTQSSPLRYVM